MSYNTDVFFGVLCVYKKFTVSRGLACAQSCSNKVDGVKANVNKALQLFKYLLAFSETGLCDSDMDDELSFKGPI